MTVTRCMGLCDDKTSWIWMPLAIVIRLSKKDRAESGEWKVACLLLSAPRVATRRPVCAALRSSPT